ncbi:hypothetical protein C3941_00015 [Kaistia algarum]|nr:hypothetical protein C3941_00015 [Kaistia algarum]
MHETAVYVAKMAHELAEMADVAGLAFLAYLLKLAELEAAGGISPDGRVPKSRRARSVGSQAG